MKTIHIPLRGCRALGKKLIGLPTVVCLESFENSKAEARDNQDSDQFIVPTEINIFCGSQSYEFNPERQNLNVGSLQKNQALKTHWPLIVPPICLMWIQTLKVQLAWKQQNFLKEML